MNHVQAHKPARRGRQSKTMGTPAIAYVRKSTVELERRSLSEQEADLRRQAEHLGLRIIRVLAEEASAYAERERPVFTEALRTVERGEAEVILCWALDRLSRRGAGHVMGLVDNGLRIVTLDGIDTAKEDGRMHVAVMAESVRSESTRISNRVLRARRAAREAGRWHGGKGPYGYQTKGSGLKLRLVVNAPQAAVVRQMAERLIRGDSVGSVARWLNAEGYPTPAGKAWKAKGKGLLWTTVGVKTLMRTPTLAGWIPHGEDVIRDTTGKPVEAHEPILPPFVWRQVQSALDARTAIASEESRAAGGRPPSRLLSGFLFCPCGERLSARSGSYACRSAAASGRHVGVTAAAEEVVARRVLRHLAALEPGDPALMAVAEAWGVLTRGRDDTERLLRQDALDVAKEELDRVVRLVAKGILDEDDAARTLPRLRVTVGHAQARLEELGAAQTDISFLLDLGRTAAEPEADPIGPGSAWAALSKDARRNVVRALVERVDVKPVRSGTKDVAGRLDVRWRGGDGVEAPAGGAHRGNRAA